MVNELRYDALLLDKTNNIIYVDVRSQSEYNKEHIPNAINIPILDDDERKVVGTMYKKFGSREAIRKGLQIAGLKLNQILSEFSKLYGSNTKIIVYCSRGGMRSGTVVSLLQSFSLPIFKLESGYKGYREYININLPIIIKQKKFITLYGSTGVAKTKLLKSLENDGYCILDLESCANHRGSILGFIGQGVPNSQKMFESLVFDSLMKSTSNIIFTEGESRRIGSVIMNDILYNQVHGGIKIKIVASLRNRIEELRNEYVSEDNIGDIKVGLYKLSKYVAQNKIDSYISLIDQGKYDEVIESLIVTYYDKNYSNKAECNTVISSDNYIECLKSLKSEYTKYSKI